MNLFIDTNILIDLVANREPYAKWAFEIFKDQKKGRWKLITSSSSVLTTFYIMEKEIGSKKAKQAIKVLLSRLEIQPTKKENLLTGLTTKFKDYEDAVQHECAMSHKRIKYIISRNKRDYKESLIEVLSSEELFFNEE
jgi:predicted nucleic acid-binding protein